ncbi:MAG: AraC family transcriptional regulator [Clostridiales bacterium]|nr:AraC family transcriptional regulator [Clostridiales bacterium]
MYEQPALIKSTGCFEKGFPFFVSRDYIDGYVSMHQHDFVELEYTVSGRGSERVNGLSHPLEPGNLTVLFPWDCHDLRARPDAPLCFLKINLDMELFMVNTSPLYRLRSIPFGGLGRRPYVQAEPDGRGELLALFESLETEFGEALPHKETLFYIKTAEILLLYDRLRAGTGYVEPAGQEDIGRVAEYVHQNYSKPLTGEETARRFRLGEEEMNRRLKGHTGLTFDELLADARVRNACARLIYHTVPVTQIGKETGFATEDVFFKTFKRIKGMSPANYRKKYKQLEHNLFSPEDMDARVVYYLHGHYGEDITLKDLARRFHYNESYLSQIIKGQTGQSFTELLGEIRVFHAAARLLTSEASVAQIGYESGFQSNETFLRAFKKHYGCPPSAYREKQAESAINTDG